MRAASGSFKKTVSRHGAEYVASHMLFSPRLGLRDKISATMIHALLSSKLTTSYSFSFSYVHFYVTSSKI